MEKRTSISASFNSKEIEIIDKLCTKLKISRGRLIKKAIAYWMINSLKDDYDKKHTDLDKLIPSIIKAKSSERNMGQFISKLTKRDKPFLAKFLQNLQTIDGLIEDHEDYHALADNKKIGRPKGIKRKRGKPKDTGVS